MKYSIPNHKVDNQDNQLYYETSENDFERLEKIGTGQFSTVYKVRSKKHNDIYAMKVIEKRPESQKEEQKKTN